MQTAPRKIVKITPCTDWHPQTPPAQWRSLKCPASSDQRFVFSYFLVSRHVADALQSFLHFISLLTATEFITLALLINKVEGVYGILALFTGYHLTALPLSMYIYSIIVFGLVCYLGPHIRRQSPLQNLTLAWIYILDTVINAAYTLLFGLSWFILLAKHLSPMESDEDAPLGANPPGGQTMNDTAGFTSPEHDVDRVEVITKPRPGSVTAGQDAVAHGIASDSTSPTSNVIFESGSMMSIAVIAALWFVRLYCVIIVMSYARTVLRQSLASVPVNPSDSSSAGNPFSPALPAGQGWRGRLGRLLVRFPKNYWLGADPSDDEWMRGANQRFSMPRLPSARRGPLLKTPAPPPMKGTGERERRARSGTGPPPPGLDGGKEAAGSGSES